MSIRATKDSTSRGGGRWGGRLAVSLPSHEKENGTHFLPQYPRRDVQPAGRRLSQNRTRCFAFVQVKRSFPCHICHKSFVKVYHQYACCLLIKQKYFVATTAVDGEKRLLLHDRITIKSYHHDFNHCGHYLALGAATSALLLLLGRGR
jgi:hypothetical protein